MCSTRSPRRSSSACSQAASPLGCPLLRPRLASIATTMSGWYSRVTSSVPVIVPPRMARETTHYLPPHALWRRAPNQPRRGAEEILPPDSCERSTQFVRQAKAVSAPDHVTDLLGVTATDRIEIWHLPGTRYPKRTTMRGMAMGKRRRARQPSMWITTTELTTSASHPFYARLNQLLREHGFDDFAEAQCTPFYAERRSVADRAHSITHSPLAAPTRQTCPRELLSLRAARACRGRRWGRAATVLAP